MAGGDTPCPVSPASPPSPLEAVALCLSLPTRLDANRANRGRPPPCHEAKSEPSGSFPAQHSLTYAVPSARCSPTPTPKKLPHLAHPPFRLVALNSHRLLRTLDSEPRPIIAVLRSAPAPKSLPTSTDPPFPNFARYFANCVGCRPPTASLCSWLRSLAQPPWNRRRSGGDWLPRCPILPRKPPYRRRRHNLKSSRRDNLFLRSR